MSIIELDIYLGKTGANPDILTLFTGSLIMAKKPWTG
jgi:hypothetical protein